MGSECNDRGSVRARKLLPEVNYAKVKLPLTTYKSRKRVQLGKSRPGAYRNASVNTCTCKATKVQPEGDRSQADNSETSRVSTDTNTWHTGFETSKNCKSMIKDMN